jgi:anaerobic ribonucleoside-triphosphate reductase activating protein
MYVNRINVNTVDHPSLIGVSVYFQGCDKFPKCDQCHNPDTWEIKEEYYFEDDFILNEIYKKLNFLLQSYSKVSLNLLGGEPFTLQNRKAVNLISKYIKDKFNDRVVILTYSWRLPHQLPKEDIENIDEFCLGEFDITKKVENRFPASTNQIYKTREELLNEYHI